MSDILNHVLTFSTDMLPERDRYDLFVEEYARKQYRIDVKRNGDVPFFSQMRMIELGRNRCIEVEYSAASYGRTAALTLDGNDDFMIPLCVASPYHSTNPELMVGVGEGPLIDLSNTGHMSNTTGGLLQMLVLPRQSLLQLVPAAEDLSNTGSVCRGVEIQLLSGYISTILAGPSIGAATLHAAGNHMLDLVALALGASGDVAHEAGARGLRAARSLALRQYIDTHLTEAGLSLAQVAKASGISERYVQRLFNDLGTSFSEHLLSQRLDLAHRLLLHPLFLKRRISAIAAEAGFGDLSYFNRSFRQRFGMTPSEVRAGS